MLDGYKTYIAAALAIITGMFGFFTETMSQAQSWQLIVLGFGLIGLGSKVERLIEK